MTLWQAIVFGVVQGLTEFLPISSIAHMRLVSAFCGWTDPGAAFSAVVQLIAYLAVLLYFRQDCIGIARGAVKGVATPEGKLGWMLIAATVPIGVTGVLFRKHIEHTWRTLTVMAWALIVLGIVLAFAEWMERRRKQRHCATSTNSAGATPLSSAAFKPLLWCPARPDPARRLPADCFSA